AYADRNTYIADPGFVDVPLAALLDTGYLKQRASLILNHRDMGRAQPGHLPTESRYRTGKSPEYPSTSHISIVDAEGNAVAMTTSIEMAFGSTLMVRGFLLNNQLTDFSFQPEDRNGAIANRVEGGKRPRSSMSPMMVFGPSNKLKLVIGSPGGSQIINYVAKTIVAVLDLGMGVQQAVGLPHFGSLNDVTYLEQGRSVSKIKPALEKMDHKVVIRKLNSGLHGILVTEEGLFGGADPRQEGVVMGE
ncbi:MAG: gamma-glutamyltransferase, partial [Gammaproteobacteria bacterium]|nr:gamma-glutamyltransferase [Gammaproteobacteria bacterium]